MTLYDSAGLALSLGERLGGGGEGEVYRLREHRERAVKVFHERRMTVELARKLAVMRARRPTDPNWSTRRHRSFAWVEDLVFHDSGRRACAGYLMPAVDLDLFRQAHCCYDTTDRVRRFGGEFTWRHLLAAAFNLATSMSALHAEGHRIGDLRETNVLVAPNALVTLVDCDSFEVHSGAGEVFPTRVGTAEYLPPELQGVDLARSADRLQADLFGLAVLVFQFLMLGAHPFQARGRAVEGAPSTDAKIRLGFFPYGARRRDLQPPEFAPPWEVIPPEVRRLFTAAFVEGHDRPDRRPRADVWAAALDHIGARLHSCPANRHHRYGGHLRACPWCRLRRSGSADPFPSVPRLGAQKPETPAGAGPTKPERQAWLRSHAQLAVADGALGPPESSFLKTLGGELGLRSQEVATVLRESTPPPAVAPAASSRTRPRGRSVLRLLPAAVVAGALGWLAPVPAIGGFVLILLPLLALAGETQQRLGDGERGWLVAAATLPRAAQMVLRSLELEVPALMASAALLGVATLTGGPLVRHLLGATATVAVGAWTWWSASAPSPDPFYAAVARSSGWLIGRAAWPPQVRRVA